MTKWTSAVRRTFDLLREVARERERGTGRPSSKREPTARRVAAGVTVEYSPDLDGDADPGEVVWTWVPYEEDPARGKDRPVVVIGRSGHELAGVPLTSKRKGRSDEVPVGTGGWDPKRRPSYAKVDRLLLIDPRHVRREGSVLDRSRFDDVVAATGRFHTLHTR